MRRLILALILTAVAAHGVVSCVAGDALTRTAGPAYHHADGTPTTAAEDAARGSSYGAAVGTAVGGAAGAPIGAAIGALASAVVGLIVRDLEKSAMAKAAKASPATAAHTLPPAQLAGAG